LDRCPETIDGLVRISDRKNLSGLGQDFHQLELAFVQVLKLVYKKMLQRTADLLSEGGIRLEALQFFK
jgi:hypothetical protein